MDPHLRMEESQISRKRSRDDASTSDEHCNGQPQKKKHRPVPVLAASGVSEERRRDIRCQQRRIHADLTSTVVGADNLEDHIQTARANNNKLFADCRYPRESVLDAENVELVADKHVQHLEHHLAVRFLYRIQG